MKIKRMRQNCNGNRFLRRLNLGMVYTLSSIALGFCWLFRRDQCMVHRFLAVEIEAPAGGETQLNSVHDISAKNNEQKKKIFCWNGFACSIQRYLVFGVIQKGASTSNFVPTPHKKCNTQQAKKKSKNALFRRSSNVLNVNYGKNKHARPAY